jgi:hypothetical protein
MYIVVSNCIGASVGRSCKNVISKSHTMDLFGNNDGYITLNDAQKLKLYKLAEQHEGVQTVFGHWNTEFSMASKVSVNINIGGQSMQLPTQFQRLCVRILHDLTVKTHSCIYELFKYGMYAAVIENDIDGEEQFIDNGVSVQVNKIISDMLKLDENSKQRTELFGNTDGLLNEEDSEELNRYVMHRMRKSRINIIPLHTVTVKFKSIGVNKWDFKVYKLQTSGFMNSGQEELINNVHVFFQPSALSPKGDIVSPLSSTAHKIMYGDWVTVALLHNIAARSGPITVEESPAVEQNKLFSTIQTQEQEDIAGTVEQHRVLQAQLADDAQKASRKMFTDSIADYSKNTIGDPNWKMLASLNPTLVNFKMNDRASMGMPIMHPPYFPKPGNIVKDLPLSALPSDSLELQEKLAEQWFARFGVTPSGLYGTMSAHASVASEVLNDNKRRFANEYRSFLGVNIHDIAMLVAPKAFENSRNTMAKILVDKLDTSKLINKSNGKKLVVDELAEQTMRGEIFLNIVSNTEIQVNVTPISSTSTTIEQLFFLYETEVIDFETYQKISISKFPDLDVVQYAKRKNQAPRTETQPEPKPKRTISTKDATPGPTYKKVRKIDGDK